MNLVASVITHNELNRYLTATIPHMLTYCDEVRVLDDHSDDGTLEWLEEQDRVAVRSSTGPTFFEHEGRARNALLDWTLEGKPTHILAIDADEIIGEPAVLRELPRSRLGVWTLVMEEVWGADNYELRIRQDGGWRAHAICNLFTVDLRLGRIADRALACGREPTGVQRRWSRAIASGTSIFHLGWANESERARRYERYAVHDGGQFHRNEHLESIMWPDDKVSLSRCAWPEGIDDLTVTKLLEQMGEDRS